MKYIKKLDLFVTRSFLMMLAGAFFVSLFVLMMQFTWRYIDELIGKGLTMDIFAQFFWYMALTVVPQAIPLAILLSSLISFGNMGERLELLAMKSAGIPLIRIMRPLIVIVTAIGGMSFYFQNVTSPNAEYQLRALLLSMHESAPALDIPEGAFYNGIPNVNLYVQKKENETGMLYNVIIYKTDRGFNKAQIVLADSAKLEITGDKHYLKLQLYSGEQFENLDASSTGRLNAYIPYDRETFAYKQLYIEFDSNFNVLDADAIGNRPESRNMAELVVGVDSMETYADSLGKANYAIVAKEGGLGTIPALNRYHNDAPKQTPAKTAAKTPAAATQAPVAKAEKKTAAPAQAAKPDKSSAEVPVTKIDIDSLFSSLSAEQKTSVINKTREKAGRVETELEWQRYEVLDIDLNMRKYMIAWHNKILLSLTCIIFFFVGAPLGSIIQKGGLGLPTVVSVIIFILYYIISTSGMKLAKEGTWEIWFGMWISAMVLVPLGAFLTYKANKDSVVFNAEAYRRFFITVLGLRTRRHITLKEVIVEDPNYADVYERLGKLAEDCREYNRRKRLWRAPNYLTNFFSPKEDHQATRINDEMESIVEELSNSRDPRILYELNRFPIIFVTAHVLPFNKPWINRTVGAILPIGLIFWLRMWKYRLRLLRDMKQIVSSCDKEREYIETLNKTEKQNQTTA